LSTKSFRALGASEHVCAALLQRGISEPFPIQELVLPDAMAGRDVLAKSPTGSGKTIAFAIPLAERISRDARTPAGLVLVPTRELAMQVADETAPLARARGLRVATAFGGVGIHGQAQRAARAHILVATPGRLEDLLERRLIRLDGVSFLVLD
jgi:ATP-dependent RNA helicase RhlE